MSFFGRIWLFFKGMGGQTVSAIENSNPEAVYESVIAERLERHKALKKAVSRIVLQRNKLQTEVEQRETDLAGVMLELPIAVESGEDEAAIRLIETRKALEVSLAELRSQLARVCKEAEESKKGLVEFKADIEGLKREKAEMVAKKANAEARITMQETLEGLSTDADIKALENVRETINQLQAQADVGAEIGENSLDAKLQIIREKAAQSSAQSELDEMKRQLAAKTQSSTVTKTI